MLLAFCPCVVPASLHSQSFFMLRKKYYLWFYDCSSSSISRLTLSLLNTYLLLCWSFAPCDSEMFRRYIDIYFSILFILFLRFLLTSLLVSFVKTLQPYFILWSLHLLALLSLPLSLFLLSHHFSLSLCLIYALY